MRNRWRRRQRSVTRPATDRVTGWIDAVITGLAHPAAGPPEAGAARICDGLFTAATVSAVLLERVRRRPEYQAAHHRCIAAAIEFMKVLGEDTLRRHRIVAVPARWDEITPGVDARLVAGRMAQLGEALQIALCAVTTDVLLSPDIREVAELYGIPAAAVVADAYRVVTTDPPG
jgi:hypothetical protein